MAKETSDNPLTKDDNIMGFAVKMALIAVIIYIGLYSFDQWMRKKDGPWTVTFQTDDNGTPMLVIDWAARGYRNCTLVFSGETVPVDFETVRTNFVDPVHLPQPVPFGNWFYSDLTYLPGTVTFDLFPIDANASSKGRRHEIELLPRGLVVNRKAHAWKDGLRIEVSAEAKEDWQETDVKY